MSVRRIPAVTKTQTVVVEPAKVVIEITDAQALALAAVLGCTNADIKATTGINCSELHKDWYAASQKLEQYLAKGCNRIIIEDTEAFKAYCEKVTI
jgi:predicted DNA-binding protein (UPF0251 family)